MKKNVVRKSVLILILCLLLSLTGCTTASVKSIPDQSTSRLSHIYQSIGEFSNGIAVVRSVDTRNYGVIDTKGNPILPCKYESISIDSTGDGLIVIEDAKRLYGFADTSGNILIPCEYEKAYPFSEGLATVKKNGVWGVIDRQGNPVWMFGEEWWANGRSVYHDGIMVISKKTDANAYVNKQGTILKELELSQTGYEFHNGYAVIRQTKAIRNARGEILANIPNKYGFIDTSMKEIMPPILAEPETGTGFQSYYWLYPKEWSDFFHDGLAICYRSTDVPKPYGYVNEAGEIISPGEEVMELHPFSEGYAVVDKYDSSYLIDTKMNVVAENFTWLYDVHDGKACATIGSKKYYDDNSQEGFFDVKNREFIPLPDGTKQAAYSPSFHDGLLRVQSSADGKYGYINGKGEFVIPCEYVDAADFNNGIARVKKFWGWGYIDKTGNPIISFDYDEAEDFVNGLAKVQKENNIIFIDTTGKEILSFNKNAEICRSGGYISVIQNNYLNIYDEQGNKTF